MDGLPPKSESDLPDSTSPYGPCPRCGRASNFTVHGSSPVTFDESGAYTLGQRGRQRPVTEQVTLLQCLGCHQNVVVIEEQYVGGISKRNGGNSGVVEWRGFHWWPTPGMRRGDPDVPERVADAIAEAERCLSVKSPRAAAVMFRAALAEMVTECGSDAAKAKSSLAAQLKQMAQDGRLDATLADWADHVRMLGNAGAHPNELEPVTQAEAVDLSRLVGSLVEYLFVTPARVRRARKGRQA